MGRVSAPFGIKGWIKVQPYGGFSASLTNYATWWLDSAVGWQQYTVQQSQVQGPDVVAKLAGCDDRDAAAGFKGRVVAVPRDAFPPAEQGEYYWADLVGLKVRNSEGLDFGVVASMLETGANAVMVVQQSAVDGATERERLIPFIADVIRRVDIAASLIEVDWGADF
jgi:16S rRNA processing protein RimM